LEYQIIPNKITYPMIAAGLIFRIGQGHWFEGVLGGFIGGEVLLIIALIYSKGMGMGDVKLLAVIGTFLGWPQAMVTLFLASLIGVLVMIPLMLLKKMDRKTPFAFGPFIALAAVGVLFYWDQLLYLFLGGG
jgi:prepilin signal peptidase PulO-like enzyme (type II secretory pathway)